ncbi:MAG: hypothetical protein NPIRA06_30690 [Nitrospirales bacterium]|nr:MAG: hypothetical protein NPIRA06_30690 [Nitrospirales bacterium]
MVMGAVLYAEAFVGDMIMIDFRCNVSLLDSASKVELLIHARRHKHVREKDNRRFFI